MVSRDDQNLVPHRKIELVPYEPNAIVNWLYERFFQHIEVDETWIKTVRAAEQKGTVVYVLRNLSFVDFFALDHLTRKHELPRIRFANDLGLRVLEPMKRGFFRSLLSRQSESDENELERVLTSHASAALFLKRPPTLTEPATRGRIEGDRFLRTLIEVQRKSDRPIVLVPQVFVWSKHGDAAKHSPLDAVFGPREWPGKIRTVAQFLANYRHVTLRAGAPLDVHAFLAQQGKKESDATLVRQMTYTLLRRLERERRSVIGPTRKPNDRLREEVLRSPRFQKVVNDMAGEGETERRVLNVKALAMLRELEASLDMSTISMLDAVVAQTIGRMYSSIEVDQAGLERVRAAAKDGTLILLPSHKSHVDYIVLSQVLYRAHMQLPLIAAGDNLNFFPMGPLLRRAGAFFIRRSFRGDRLYAAVVDAYMRRLIKDGFSLEFFLEGGRSRTGKLLSPKVGLLSMVVDAALGASQPIYFVPVSIGYERLVEEKSYVAEATGGEKKKENIRELLGSADMLTSRYGRLSVQFGELLTLAGVQRELEPASSIKGISQLTPPQRRALVTRLGYRVMNEINRVTAVTPGSLVAMALLTHGKPGIPHDELTLRCQQIARTLDASGARFSPSLSHPLAVASPTNAAQPGRIRLEAIHEALDLFLKVGHAEARVPSASGKQTTSNAPRGDAVYVVPDDARMSLELAKNIIVHFFVSRAMVATALLAHRRQNQMTTVPLLRERVQILSRLFKFEFQFRANATFDQIYDDTLAEMIRDGEISRDAATDALSPNGDLGREQITLYMQTVKSFVEGYRIAARSLTHLIRGSLSAKELTKKAIATGERMILAGEIERREAINRSVIENAFASFVDLRYLNREGDKITLPESYESAEAVATIEARISAFIAPIEQAARSPKNAS